MKGDKRGFKSLYLIEERGLHTAVKLNPTLLGPERVRGLLNQSLGYRDVVVPDAAFEHDLKYGRAIELIRSLGPDVVSSADLVQQFHDNVGLFIGLARVINPQDVRVIEIPGSLGLVKEKPPQPRFLTYLTITGLKRRGSPADGLS